ncbi:MAG: sigma-70 family RNA polymerase sigma factor [Bacteroidota bacterium]
MKKNNKKAFAILYKRHASTLIHSGFKITPQKELVKDTLQELFTEFWNKRSTLSEVKSVKVYLLRAFRFKLLRAISTKGRTRKQEIHDVSTIIDDTANAGSDISDERITFLKEKIALLPERQREIINLKFFQNLSNQEISDIVNINYQSVSNLLYRAIKKLKSSLKSSDSAQPSASRSSQE